MGKPHGFRPSSPRAADVAYLVRLGERVRAERDARGYSRRRLSELSGVSERFIAHLELGQGNISILRLKAIVDAMGVPLTHVITDDANERARNALTDTVPNHPATVAELFRNADPSFQEAVIELLQTAARDERVA